MATLHRSVATLRIVGDALVPDQISSLLGAEASKEQTKGEKIVGPKTGRVRIARFGMWRLHASEQIPSDLDAQVKEILDQLTPDLAIWEELSRQFEMDLFCGLFMDAENEGIALSSDTLAALGQRHIELGLDIYGSSQD